MQTEYKDKSMGAPAVKAETPKPEAKKKEFFYPGEMKYKPTTITARNQEEADALHEKEREPAE